MPRRFRPAPIVTPPPVQSLGPQRSRSSLLRLATPPRTRRPVRLRPRSPAVPKFTASIPTASLDRVWSDAQDIVYAITFDRDGRPIARNRQSRQDLPAGFGLDEHGAAGCLAHSGNGIRHRTRTARSTRSPEISGRCTGSGRGLEKTGTFESEVLDAGSFAYWGRLSYRGEGNISVFTRAGNLNHPQSNWSAWAPLQPDADARRHLRFLRRRAFCVACGALPAIQDRVGGRRRAVRRPRSPTSTSRIWRRTWRRWWKKSKSLRPTIGSRSPRLRLCLPTSLTLPPLGQTKKASPVSDGADRNISDTELRQRLCSVRWAASDENDDTPGLQGRDPRSEGIHLGSFEGLM